MWSSSRRKILWGHGKEVQWDPLTPMCPSLCPYLLLTLWPPLRPLPDPFLWVCVWVLLPCKSSAPFSVLGPLTTHHFSPLLLLHVLDIASSHNTHRDCDHSQEEDPAVIEGHLEEILGTGAAEPQGGQQEEQQQQQCRPGPGPQLHSGHLWMGRARLTRHSGQS